VSVSYKMTFGVDIRRRVSAWSYLGQVLMSRSQVKVQGHKRTMSLKWSIGHGVRTLLTTWSVYLVSFTSLNPSSEWHHEARTHRTSSPDSGIREYRPLYSTCILIIHALACTTQWHSTLAVASCD